MKNNLIPRPAMLAVLAATVLVCVAFCGAAEDESRWVNPLCQTLDATSNGPFTELADGSLMTIDASGMRVSKDDGKTWSEGQPVCEGIAGPSSGRQEPAAFYVVRAKSGRALVAVFLNFATYNFSWDDAINQPRDDCRLEVWAVRSLDGGKTRGRRPANPRRL